MRARAGIASIALLLVVSPPVLTADTPLKMRWTRINVEDPMAASAIRYALDRASELVSKPACRAVLEDFGNARGHSIARELTDRQLEPVQHLASLLFYEGADELCATRVFYTSVNGRVVFVCTRELAREMRARPHMPPLIVIHEMLHTLGLREDPPSSFAVTRQVAQRCDQM